MDFELSEDQIMMRDSAREFANKRLKDIAEELDAKGTMPDELLAETGELGYFGLLVPDHYGGLEVDMLSYALVIEEIARKCAGLAITLSVHNSLVIRGINTYGTDEHKEKYLPKLATGEIIGAYSLSEPGSGTDAGSLKTTAIADGDHYVLNGTKNWVSTAQWAKVFIVFVLTNPEAGSGGISCLLVESGTEGMSLGVPEKKMGLKCSDTRDLSFIDAKVSKTNLLGEENNGRKLSGALRRHSMKH
jgi:alkylation response protein AidB-like acyl-CoA dehydrogenase